MYTWLCATRKQRQVTCIENAPVNSITTHIWMKLSAAFPSLRTWCLRIFTPLLVQTNRSIPGDFGLCAAPGCWIADVVITKAFTRRRLRRRILRLWYREVCAIATGDDAALWGLSKSKNDCSVHTLVQLQDDVMLGDACEKFRFLQTAVSRRVTKEDGSSASSVDQTRFIVRRRMHIKRKLTRHCRQIQTIVMGKCVL